MRRAASEHHEGQDAARLEVGGAQDQLSKAGLIQVLDEERHVALAPAPRPRADRSRGPRPGRDLPQRAPQAALPRPRVEHGLEGLGETAAVAQEGVQATKTTARMARAKMGTARVARYGAARASGSRPGPRQEPRGAARHHEVGDEDEGEEQPRDRGRAQSAAGTRQSGGQERHRGGGRGTQPVEGGEARRRPRSRPGRRASLLPTTADSAAATVPTPGADDEVDLHPALVEGPQHARVIRAGRAASREHERRAPLRRVLLQSSP